MRKIFLVCVGLLALTVPVSAAIARPLYPLCGDEKLRSCVVDGNTFWYGGEFMRLQDVFPPEPTQQACAPGATQRLKELLNSGEIFVFRYGTDAEGHTLSRVISQGRDVSDVLVSEELATSSSSSGGAWCD